MLAKSKMQEIQDIELRGFTKTEIAAYYKARGEKPPGRPTINKYYDMDVVPENLEARLAKDRSFDVELFRCPFPAQYPAAGGIHPRGVNWVRWAFFVE